MKTTLGALAVLAIIFLLPGCTGTRVGPERTPLGAGLRDPRTFDPTAWNLDALRSKRQGRTTIEVRPPIDRIP
ncbi:MAG: hypothetical protein GC202_00135 [Alphaproteobacteria bacterium]|nr:hypothetical protein [Alphaproteobacteria bacterium]